MLPTSKAPTKEEFVKKELQGKKINVYTWEYVRAAIELGLSYRFFTPPHEAIEKYVEISNDKSMIRITNAMLPLNDVVAAVIAKKKPATNSLLKQAGIPVSNQVVITDLGQLGDQLKYPLVVKPLTLTGGLGITADIKDQEGLEKAWQEAKSLAKESAEDPEAHTPIIIEEMIQAYDHRLFILDGEMIAAIKKNPPTIKGDGKSTVQQLIDAENATEQRVSKKISSIKVDNDLLNTLKNYDLKLDSIPESGHEIMLHKVSNLSRGSTTENVTDKVHPEFASIAVKAAQIVGLKAAGVDFMAEDISKPPAGQVHGIIEVNAHPGTRLHLYPNIGDPVDVPRMVLSRIFNL